MNLLESEIKEIIKDSADNSSPDMGILTTLGVHISLESYENNSGLRSALGSFHESVIHHRPLLPDDPASVQAIYSDLRSILTSFSIEISTNDGQDLIML